MDIQINTDKNIEGGDKFSQYVNGVVQEAISGFNSQITHVGLYFSDQNSSKVGFQDKRCVMEFHIKGRSSTAVSHDADSVDEALAGAVEKARHSIEHTLGKIKKH